jgi:DNA-binding CsgD family transcriptional regulator
VLEEAHALAREHADYAGIAYALGHLGLRAAMVGDLTESLHLLQEALRQAEQCEDGHHLSFTLAALGYRSMVQGDYQEAAGFCSASVSGFRAAGNVASATMVEFTLAVALKQLGEIPRAVRLIQDGLRTSLAHNNRWQLSHGLDATVSLVGGDAGVEQRTRVMGAADALIQATGTKFGMLARVTGRDSAGLHEPMEQEVLRDVYQAGRSLSFPEVVELALAVLADFSQVIGDSEAAAKEQGHENRLSPRELEVLHLVAEGLTSKQIGNQLFLSPKTVNYHLTSVFNKLGVDSRAQAVAVAARKGLL